MRMLAGLSLFHCKLPKSIFLAHGCHHAGFVDSLNPERSELCRFFARCTEREVHNSQPLRKKISIIHAFYIHAEGSVGFLDIGCAFLLFA